jgi:uncharacterized membrane protein required for colicin V production
VSYVFGVLAAMKFGPIMGDQLVGWFPAIGASGSFLLGVILVFFLTLVLFKIVAKGLTSFLETVNINFINQILGGILSGLFFVFIFSGLVYFGDQTRIITDEHKAKSITYPVLEKMPDFVIDRGRHSTRFSAISTIKPWMPWTVYGTTLTRASLTPSSTWKNRFLRCLRRHEMKGQSEILPRFNLMRTSRLKGPSGCGARVR